MPTYRFNDDEREQYRREGYIVVDSVFTADDVAPVDTPSEPTSPSDETPSTAAR